MEGETRKEIWTKSEILTAIGLSVMILVIVSGAIGIVTMMQVEAQQTKRSIEEIRSLMQEHEKRRDQQTEKINQEIKNVELQITEIRATQQRR